MSRDPSRSRAQLPAGSPFDTVERTADESRAAARRQRSRLLTAALLAATTCSVQASDWQQVDGSTLGFVGSAQGESFEGTFSQFEAQIRFDPSQLDQARFDVSIQLGSADTQNAERDELLHSGEFFAVERQAQARYLAERFEADGTGGFVAHGELTLNQHTRPVDLHFQWRSTGEGAELVGSAELDRMQFDVGVGEWQDPDSIAHRVEVRTRLQLRPK